MSNIIKIKDVAEKYGISTRTLRYYEDMGLISSHRSDDYAYRSYGEETLRILEQILVLRKLNVSIKDIKRILAQPNLDIILEVLGGKVKDIDEEVALLHELKDILSTFIKHIKTADFTKDSDVKMLYEQANEIEQQIVKSDTEEVVDLDELLNRFVEVNDKLAEKQIHMWAGDETTVLDENGAYISGKKQEPIYMASVEIAGENLKWTIEQLREIEQEIAANPTTVDELKELAHKLNWAIATNCATALNAKNAAATVHQQSNALRKIAHDVKSRIQALDPEYQGEIDPSTIELQEFEDEEF